MRFSSTSLLIASVAVFTCADPVYNNPTSRPRGLPEAPNGYTPARVTCPANRPVIRDALTLSPQESSWLKVRRPKTLGPMADLLERMDIKGFDAKSYIKQHKNNVESLPNIAIAASGGGYRALMNGGGALSAFDSRTPHSTSKGHLGGLLQSATYLSALSGGGWLVGSIYSNNFTSVQQVLRGKDGSTWDFGTSIFDGPPGFFSSVEYYQTLFDQVTGKQNAGFNITITDVWGRALAFQLINANDGGPAYTWSSLADNDFITQGTAPLPILIADGRAPGEEIIPTNTNIYEFNPWEFGSFDPAVFGFAPMKYVGSPFSGGAVPSDEQCVLGYDSASFVMGTSSSLFNQFALQFSSFSSNLPDFVIHFLNKLLISASEAEIDIAQWVNPFFKFNPKTNPTANTQSLTLVDGGENLENIPLHPLIQPVRAVDVIIAIDSSADTDTHWPNGTSLVATYQRSLNAAIQNHTSFPSIPDQNTFVNLGLNLNPTFFGCDAENNTQPGTTGPPPLIVYIPNAPYTGASNISTFDSTYSDAQRDSVIYNGYNVATRGNLSTDMWPTCLGCAILHRSLVRTNTSFPNVCKQCFNIYCWDGTLNSTTPSLYEPKPIIGLIKVAGAAGLAPRVFGAVSVAALAASLLLL